MHEYWTTLEELYASLNKDEERKIGKYQTQFLTTPEQRKTIVRCHALLDASRTLAKDPKVKQRIELFSKSFELSQYFFGATASDELTDEMAEKIRDYARREIVPDPMAVYRRVKPGQTAEEVVMAEIEKAIKKVRDELKKTKKPE